MKEKHYIINQFNQRNLQALGTNYNHLQGQYNLRYKVIYPLGWEVFFDHEHKIEVDEYDTPLTEYFTLYDELKGETAACARLCRTDMPYPQRGNNLSFMLKDHFFDAVEGDLSEYCTPEYREGSRLCVLSDYDRGERRDMVAALLIGMMNFCVDNNIVGILGIMPPKVQESTWSRLGIDPHYLGPVTTLSERDIVQARVNYITPEKLKRAEQLAEISVTLNSGDMTQQCLAIK